MSIGQVIQIVGAFLLLSWTIRTALLWSTAGIAGAIKGIGAFLLVIGVIAIIGVPLVDMVYVRFRTQLPSTTMAKDAENVIGAAVDVVGEKPAVGWLAAPEGEQAIEALPWGAPEGVQPTPAPGVQPTLVPVPRVQPTPVAGAVVPQVAQPQRQLIQDPTERASCWREVAFAKGIQTSITYGAAWFPAGTPCTVEWGLGTLWRRDRFWVSCLDLGLERLELTKALGGQLAKLAGTSGGTFYGTGTWPPECYIEVAVPTPTPPPEAEENPSTTTQTQAWITLELYPMDAQGKLDTCEGVNLRVSGATLPNFPVELYRDNVSVLDLITANNQGIWSAVIDNTYGIWHAEVPGVKSQVWDHHQTCPSL